MSSTLHGRARKLVEHYRRYGMLTHETARPERVAESGQEVIWLLDYVSLAGDLEHCLDYCRATQRNDLECNMHQLSADKEEIDSILTKQLLPEELAKMLGELTDQLDMDCSSLGGADLFYYEHASGSRSLIEICVELLRKIGKEQLVPLEVGESVGKSDARMRALIAEIEVMYPSLERPFPPCPEYTPKSYWWFLR